MNQWGVYLLRCGDGTLYCGVTNDMEKRLCAHRAGKGARYTRGRGPLTLLHFTGCRFDHGTALQHEHAIKKLAQHAKTAYLEKISKTRRVKRPQKKKSCFEEIPGVGPCMASDLHDLGLHNLADLQNANPEVMYKRLCDLRGSAMDRCVLYVFRCAVYYACTPDPDPKKLKWWHWKDTP